jgi:uncharacterized protein
MYKAETASWFRIVEMFQFQSFHMYGFIGSALVIGIIATQIIKRKKAKDVDGQPILINPKDKSINRYLLGGILFGLGWALIGACPGPLFVLLGAGTYSIIIVTLAAITGTWLYGILREKLPH